jgi:hypothetical protein
MKKTYFPGLMIVLLVCCSFLCLGDTIYLKNGEKIQTSYAKVVGNQIVFSKFGGTISLPMSLVDRIESDNFIEPKQSSEAAPTTSPAPAPSTTRTLPTTSSSTQNRLDMQKRNAQYWTKRKEELTKRLNEAEQKLQAARTNNLALRYAGGAGLAQTSQQVEALEREIAQLREQLANLEDDARKFGISPGVLRE